MSHDKIALITQLCDSWVDSTKDPSGGRRLGNDFGSILSDNDIWPPTLNYDEIQAYCIGLTRTLMPFGMTTVIGTDHYLLWSWGAQILNSIPRNSLFSISAEIGLRELFDACIGAALALAKTPITSDENSSLDFNQFRYSVKSHLVLAYLSLPLLEAVLKKVCPVYVNQAGQVQTPFQKYNAGGMMKTRGGGNPDTYTVNSKCSSLRDLLHLLDNQVADADLRTYLNLFKAHLTSIDPTQHPYDLIYSWRNPTLHGHTNFQTIGGILLNLSILIGFNHIRSNYEQRRDEVLEAIQWAMQSSSGFRPMWIYYPPF